jgi:hypothetical protein
MHGLAEKIQHIEKANANIHGYRAGNVYASTNFDSPADNYIYGRDLIRKAGEKPDWQQSTGGRILTRIASRGVFGALAFTWAGNHSTRAMRNYAPRSIQTFGEWGRALVNLRTTAPMAGTRIKLASGEWHTVRVGENDPNTFQAIAKMFDVTLGKPTQFVARLLAPAGKADEWARQSVLFRKRQFFHDPIASFKLGGEYEIREFGRSLGHEMVIVSSDFAAASAVDSTMRNVVECIDPNVEKNWFDKEGHFSTPQFARDMGKRAWRVVSFNQGEDWAVAFPYVMYMKWQRNVIDNFSPQFKIASDNPHWNGASLKLRRVTRPGQPDKLEIIGDYQVEGMFDLWGRFGPAYNTLTLIYREAYTSVGRALNNWWNGDSWIPPMSMPDRPIASTIGAVGDTGRYLLKSFMKSSIYMTPAVPFFWISRISQSQWRTSPILLENPADTLAKSVNRIPSLKENTPEIVHRKYLDILTNEYGLSRQMADDYLLLARLPKESWDVLEKNIGTAKYINDLNLTTTDLEHFKTRLNHFKAINANGNHVGWDLYKNRYIPGLHMEKLAKGESIWFGGTEITHHPFKNYDPHAIRNATSLFDALTNPFGRISQMAGEGLYRGLEKMNWLEKAGPFFGVKRKYFVDAAGKYNAADHKMWIRDGARKAVDASIAYTPYMIAKAETALRWDNKHMDRALYDTIDHTFSFRWGDAKQSLGRVWDLILHPPAQSEVQVGEKKSSGVKVNVPNETMPANTTHKKEQTPSHIPTNVLLDVSHQSRVNAARMHPEHRTIQ